MIDTISGFFSRWQRYFDPNIRKSWLERFWVSCHAIGCKWAILVSLTVQTLSTLDCIMSHTTVLDASPTIRFVAGIYSCTWAVYLFAFKRNDLLLAANQLLSVARVVEADFEKGRKFHNSFEKEAMQRTAVKAGRYMRGLEYWSGFTFLSLWIPSLLTGRPATPTWPEPTTPLGRYSLHGLHMFSTVFLPVAFFTGVAMVAGFLNCSAALLRALGSRLENSSTESELFETVMLTSSLNKGIAIMRGVFHPIIIHLLQSSIFMPLMATYELLNGQVDLFLFATGPLNVVIFIPLCFAGQGLEEAGHEMSNCAYRGRWLEESVFARLLRLQVMLRARNPARASSREVGSINLQLCQNSLRSWFSYLNFMINTMQ